MIATRSRRRSKLSRRRERQLTSIATKSLELERLLLSMSEQLVGHAARIAELELRLALALSR